LDWTPYPTPQVPPLQLDPGYATAELLIFFILTSSSDC